MMTDTTNDRTSDPEAIERDIERTRADMQDTLDALQRKLSPGQILDQALDYMQQGPGDFVNILGTTIKHNPIPAALLGVSLGWLMLAGPRRPPEVREHEDVAGRDVREDRPEEYREYRDERDFRDYDELVHPGAFEDRHYTVESSAAGTARYAGTAQTGGARAYAAPERGPAPMEHADKHADKGPSTMERLGAKASELAHDARELAHDARERVADLASGVRERIAGRSQPSGTGGRMSGMGRGARERMSGMAHSARDTMGRAAHGATEQISRAADTTRRFTRSAGERAGYARQGMSDMMQNNPLMLGALGLVIGVAIGYALPSTRREDEMLGPSRDELLNRARQAGEEGLHKAQEVGARAYDAAKEEVRKQTGLSEQEESSRQAGMPAEERTAMGGEPSPAGTAGVAGAFGAEPGYRPAGEDTATPGGEEGPRATARTKRAGSAGSAST